MKDKAKELVERFNNIRSEEPCFIISLNQAKQCALIAVDEILLFLQLQKGFRDNEATEYWQGIKTEIEKL